MSAFLQTLISITGLDSLHTFESRLFASIAVVLFVGIIGVIVLPRLASRTMAVVSNGIFERTDEKYREVFERYISPEVDFELWVTVFGQSALVGFGAGGLLLIWGESEAAITFVTAIMQSLPELGRITASVLTLISAYLGSQLIDRSLSRINDTDRWNDHQARMVFRTLQVLMFVALGVILLSIWEIKIEGLLVGAGFLGIIVGMATRQTIGALIAGFVLMFSRPFEIGDWVAISDTEGIIIDITMVNTRIENRDGEIVVLPNDIVSDSVIRNRTRKGRLRMTLEVGADYDADPVQVQDVAEGAMERVDDVLKIPNPKAIPIEFGASGVLFELQFWIDKPSQRRRERTRAEVIREVKHAFEQADITIPYPQRQVSYRTPESSQNRRDVDLTDFHG